MVCINVVTLEILLLLKSDNLQYNTLVCLFAGTNDSSAKHLMIKVWFFFSWFLAKFFVKMVSMYLFILFFINLQKSKQRVLSALSLQQIMRKIMLGTSDAWSTSHLSQQPSKPAYYIVDCWTFGSISRTANQNTVEQTYDSMDLFCHLVLLLLWLYSPS